MALWELSGRQNGNIWGTFNKLKNKNKFYIGETIDVNVNDKPGYFLTVL